MTVAPGMVAFINEEVELGVALNHLPERLRPARAAAEKICAREGCGRVFNASRAGQRFCSRTCGALNAAEHNRPKWDTSARACGFAGCGKMFVPKTPAQKCCCGSCGAKLRYAGGGGFAGRKKK